MMSIETGPRIGRIPGSAPIKRRSDLMTRALGGLAMIAVAIAALWAGGIAFWLLASAAASLMMAEWAGMAKAARWKIALAIILAGAVMVSAGSVAGDPYAFLPSGHVPSDVVALCVVGAVILSFATFSMRLGGGLLYATLPAVALIYLRVHHGVALTLWTLAVVWATDIGAYFSGRAIGGPKLAPGLSPNKTWAGLGGGVLAASLVGAAIASGFGLPRALLLLGAPMAVLAQMGDLFESWLKRKAGVKDSGRLLPGHGGALDRLDGVVPVATLMGLLAAMGVL